MPSLSDLQQIMQRQLEDDRQRQLVNVTAFTIEEAIHQAAVELSLSPDRIEYEVIERGGRGLFGLQKRPFLIMAYPAHNSQKDDPETTAQSKDSDGGCLYGWSHAASCSRLPLR